MAKAKFGLSQIFYQNFLISLIFYHKTLRSFIFYHKNLNFYLFYMTSKTKESTNYPYRVLQDKQTNEWFLEISYNPNKIPVIYKIDNFGQSTLDQNVKAEQLTENHSFEDHMDLSAIQQVFLLVQKPNIEELLFFFKALLKKIQSLEYHYDSSRDFSMEIAYKLEDFKSMLLQNSELIQDDEEAVKFAHFDKEIDNYFYDQKKVDNVDIANFIMSMIKELELVQSQ